MKELSVAELRYQAIMTVIGDGLAVTQAAEKGGVAPDDACLAGPV
jgi:hypothetical protein